MNPVIEGLVAELNAFKKRYKGVKGNASLEGALILIDEIINGLNKSISSEDLKRKISLIENFKLKIKRLNFEGTIGDILAWNNKESLAKIGESFSIEGEFQMTAYVEPTRKFELFKRHLPLKDLLIKLHAALFSEYMDNINTYNYFEGSENEKVTQLLQSYVSDVNEYIKRKDIVEGALVDFERDALVEGLDFQGKTKQQISINLKSFAGSDAKGKYLCHFGTQSTSYLYKLLLPVLLRPVMSNMKIQDGVFSGYIRWSKDGKGNLIGELQATQHVAIMRNFDENISDEFDACLIDDKSNLENADFKFIDAYFIDPTTKQFRKVDDIKDSYIIRATKISKQAVPKIADICLQVKVSEPEQGKLLIEFPKLTYKTYTKYLVSTQEKVPGKVEDSKADLPRIKSP